MERRGHGEMQDPPLGRTAGCLRVRHGSSCDPTGQTGGVLWSGVGTRGSQGPLLPCSGMASPLVVSALECPLIFCGSSGQGWGFPFYRRVDRGLLVNDQHPVTQLLRG